MVATAGTTNTGSIDPLEEIADICRCFDLWMHVDGAYGASCFVRAGTAAAFGIALSDSISWDAHKWMMQTYGCSVVLVREQKNLLRSFSTHPEYLEDAKTEEACPISGIWAPNSPVPSARLSCGLPCRLWAQTGLEK